MSSSCTAESDVLRTLTHRSCTSILTKRGKLREHSSEEETRVLAVAQERLTKSLDESAGLRDQSMYSYIERGSWHCLLRRLWVFC